MVSLPVCGRLLKDLNGLVVAPGSYRLVYQERFLSLFQKEVLRCFYNKYSATDEKLFKTK